jgi:hypothetical protein
MCRQREAEARRQQSVLLRDGLTADEVVARCQCNGKEMYSRGSYCNVWKAERQSGLDSATPSSPWCYVDARCPIATGSLFDSKLHWAMCVVH